MSPVTEVLDPIAEAQKMQSNYLLCRTFGHAWDPEETVASREGITLKIMCTRCGTYRTDRVSREDGAIEGRAYEYASGYRGHGKITRNVFRFEFITRETTTTKSRKK